MHDRCQQRRFVFESNGHGVVVEVDREKGNPCMVRENYCIRADTVLMDRQDPRIAHCELANLRKETSLFLSPHFTPEINSLRHCTLLDSNRYGIK